MSPLDTPDLDDEGAVQSVALVVWAGVDRDTVLRQMVQQHWVRRHGDLREGGALGVVKGMVTGDR